tara:strand:+ start:688 stop:804 length:117 start_codon:yes stop_codon:yes gene_type:complete
VIEPYYSRKCKKEKDAKAFGVFVILVLLGIGLFIYSSG